MQGNHTFTEINKAEALGIEALKAVKDSRNKWGKNAILPMLGETKE